MSTVHVLSLGGSILVPNEIDSAYIGAFFEMLRRHFADCPDDRVVLVVGGGGPARAYQSACRSIRPDIPDEALDWIGVAATKLNATLVRHGLGDLCEDPVVTDPSSTPRFTGRVLVGSGWKPGFSTDFDAVLLAEHLHARRVYNLSNIAYVYDSDPKTNPAAKPLETLSWKAFRSMVGNTWTPGGNLPFDPIAAARAHEGGLQVVVGDGRNLENIAAMLRGRPFEGTVIGGT